MENKTIQQDYQEAFTAIRDVYKTGRSRKVSNWLKGFFIGFFLLLFVPWTQNVSMSGKLTSIDPGHRPQTIHSSIPGRIEKWFVYEGQSVKKGDTILFLSEVKDDYFDPELLNRTDNQIASKKQSIDAYRNKLNSLKNQYESILKDKSLKTRQAENKVNQARLKMVNDSMKVIEAETKLIIAKRQYEAAQNLHNKGINSMVELESRRNSFQQAQTERTSALNNYIASETELNNQKLILNNLNNEFDQKLAYNQADQFSIESSIFDADATVSKMQVSRTNYGIRRSMYYITAPQDGIVVKALKTGLGEIIKEGTPLLQFQPYPYTPAVELYVEPIDLPLMEVGHDVRIRFDGWPTIVFNGWPGLSFGTFGGKIVSIDQSISENGKYRLLVSEDTTEGHWPDLVRQGSGAYGITLLKDVPIWYELWRNINGFPPDFYKAEKPKDKGDKASKEDK